MNFETWVHRSSHLIFISILCLYILLAILAPIFMKIGLDYPAKFIYWIYSNFCHQFAHRSWFLFGDQPFYPLYPSANSNLTTFQEAFGYQENDTEFSRSIIGNDLFGYKMAFCQRDLAIYGSLLIFGLIYLLTGKKLKRIPLLFWILLGVIPLGIDGVFQLFGSNQVGIPLIGIWESTPFIRSITGGLFGLFTGWFIYPSIDLIKERQNKRDYPTNTETELL